MEYWKCPLTNNEYLKRKFSGVVAGRLSPVTTTGCLIAMSTSFTVFLIREFKLLLVSKVIHHHHHEAYHRCWDPLGKEQHSRCRFGG